MKDIKTATVSGYTSDSGTGLCSVILKKGYRLVNIDKKRHSKVYLSTRQPSMVKIEKSQQNITSRLVNLAEHLQ
jgi:hypothetical protein